MAANSRAKATWVLGDVPTAAQFNTLDANGAGAVARASTGSGTKLMPLCYVASGPVKTVTKPYLDAGHKLAMDNDDVTGAPTEHEFDLVGLPNGHTLTAVTVKFDPVAGHGGQPDNLPGFSVLRVTADGTTNSLGSGTYSWVDVSTYEAGMTCTLSGLTEVIDCETYRYLVDIYNESGTNSIAGCVIASIACTVTVDTAAAGADFTFWV